MYFVPCFAFRSLKFWDANLRSLAYKYPLVPLCNTTIHSLIKFHSTLCVISLFHFSFFPFGNCWEFESNRGSRHHDLVHRTPLSWRSHRVWLHQTLIVSEDGSILEGNSGLSCSIKGRSIFLIHFSFNFQFWIENQVILWQHYIIWYQSLLEK